MPIPVIAIFDIGKTNKKLFLFDESYHVIFEKSGKLQETTDEDGDPCEQIDALINFVHESLQEVLLYKYYDLKAINFSAYGATLVFIDETGKPVSSLYNYLKPYPEELKKQFYNEYGGASNFSNVTASPVLGSLNSGMQLYRLKHQRPLIFNRTKHALHLPQFFSFLITGRAYSDITSIGCHTNLWNFQTNDYHDWLAKEQVLSKLAPIIPSDHVSDCKYDGHEVKVGVGLHDSSAALIPYLKMFNEPFVLISTGTWCISLNPFNNNKLTQQELERDCLCYFSYSGRPVKASRLFSGHEYDEQVKRIALHYNKVVSYYQTIAFNVDLVSQPDGGHSISPSSATINFSARNLSDFKSDDEAYHKLVYDLVTKQYHATHLVLNGSPVKRILVDGGFSRNEVFMNLLALFFPELEIYAASLSQGTALGSALAIHDAWNNQPEPKDLIDLKYYGKRELVA
jgi:sugar (pentulose or hexulose) kinase